MGSDDFEASITGIKFLTNIKRDECGIVSGEEILVAWLELPVINFV